VRGESPEGEAEDGRAEGRRGAGQARPGLVARDLFGEQDADGRGHADADRADDLHDHQDGQGSALDCGRGRHECILGAVFAGEHVRVTGR
jgi:hypothetical protein